VRKNESNSANILTLANIWSAN